MSINLKNLSRLTFSFAPFEASYNCRSIRELLARCTTPKAEASNPKCAVDVKVRRSGAPYVAVVFASGHKENIYTSDKKVQDILDAIQQRTEEADTLGTLKEAGFNPEEKLVSDWN
eukprot:evm.model.scf_1630.2 EVM.evm.TU.scf_1630.2   scf_1630:4090-4437(-)